MKYKGNHIRKQSIILFHITGFCALLWFLIRVIPKPSRAAYPCQRAAFPLASGFIIHLSVVIAGSQLFRKGIRKSREKKLAGILWILPAILIIVLAGLGAGMRDLRALGTEQYTETPNQPVGKAKGVIPGRVVWVWNPDAVNENCPNTWLEDDNWWMEHNTDREKVHEMLESSLCILTGTDLAIEAWDSIFMHFNRERGAGDVAYREGEKICIKTNFVSCNATNMDGHNKKENLNMIDASPQIMWSVLNQLSNICGIPQSSICMGDPSAYFPNQYHDLLKTDFPDVVYLSVEDGAEGRTKIISSAEEVLQFSDGSGGDYFPVQFIEADYMINISVTKHHSSAGFSQIAKNHYGSNMRHTASHMHGTLVDARQGTRKYRHFVDLLGHEDLGGNTLLNIGDFLWSGHQAWTTPDKFTTVPFLNDYPSSILVSMDPLAVESVGLDFIQTQSWGDQYATTTGVDDYLLQAADSSFWPRGIDYDPEGDGSVLASLGVFEHWNNDEDKQYSGNLGMQGGIELVMVIQHRKIVSPTAFSAVYTEEPQEIMLSWKDLSESEEVYVLERAESDGDHFTGLAQLGPNEISYTDTDIEPGMLYYYRIRTAAGGDTTIAETISQLAAFASGSRDLRQEKVPFKVFPNPASDVFTIECIRGTVIVSISIIDMNGSLMKQFRPAVMVNRTLFTFSCQDLGRGSYLIRVDTEEGKWTLPLLVAK